MKLVSLFARPLGVDSTPFGHFEKCAALASIAPVVAGLMGQVSSIASAGGASSYNLAATKLTNDTNLELARQTNEMSQAQFEENMRWLREQFYKQREYALDERAYNDPAAIVQRLIKAGVNPAAFFGSGSTSTPSVSSVGAPSQSNFQTGYQQAPHMDPVSYDLSGVAEGIGRAVDAFHQNKLIDAQTEKTGYESQIQRANSVTQLMDNVQKIRNMMADTDEKLANTNLSKSQRELYETQRQQLEGQIGLFMNTIDEQMKSLQLSNQRVEREMKHLDKVEEGMALDDALKKIDINFKPLVYSAGLRMSDAQISEVKQHINNLITDAYNGRLQGMNLSRDAIAKDLENKLRAMHVLEESTKHGIRNGKNKATEAVYYFADYLGRIIGSPLRGLFK